MGYLVLSGFLFLVVVVQIVVIYKLMRRPQFQVYKLQEKELEKERKAKEAITKSFENFRASNGRDILILNVKESVDADALAILLARIMSSGQGLAGDIQNIEGLVTAIYGPGEELPAHLNHLLYANRTKAAIWEGRPNMPHSLNKLITKD